MEETSYRVTIFYRHALFARGLAHLLSAQGHRLETLPQETPLTESLARELTPDVVIAETTPGIDTARLRRRIDRWAPGVRVILLSLEDNKAQVFDRRQVEITDPGDLVTLITL